ncbi:DUF4148 domain-containing protein [Paraburkholderia rhizosphaerae]|uniref:Uncharacterized protein DUF4148 n=1 Tax=Paraburkholderia rhizosphaerae TaxID=480658 RepID=A0A4R8L4D1_9BURK|nr:DUF4148 domain-containing protein [Paraburkholderia rhizosphaerae]TDY37456.1 uncharacterized protein DUF4148 [Paraburkholderia rhizosphaerae]
MKASITTLTAIITLASSMAVRAQTNVEAPSQPQNITPAQASQMSQSPAPTTTNLTSMEKTRAQVYRELVQAQRDGQIARLNRTVYAHH